MWRISRGRIQGWRYMGGRAFEAAVEERWRGVEVISTAIRPRRRRLCVSFRRIKIQVSTVVVVSRQGPLMGQVGS